MPRELQGSLEGDGLKIGIVVARFNEFVTAKLLAGALAALAEHGVQDGHITVAWVPGSFEIPVIARKMAESGRHDAVVSLGAVIKGETDHYHHVAGEAARGVAAAAFTTGVPVVFGVLTTDTVEQAIERAGGEDAERGQAPRPTSKARSGDDADQDHRGNTGYNAAVSAIEMANLVRALRSG